MHLLGGEGRPRADRVDERDDRKAEALGELDDGRAGGHHRDGHSRQLFRDEGLLCHISPQRKRTDLEEPVRRAVARGRRHPVVVRLHVARRVALHAPQGSVTAVVP